MGFGSFCLAEFEDIETVSTIARLIDEFGEKVASHVWGHLSSNADEARRILEECFEVAWNSLEDWAEELLESSGDVDQVQAHLRPNIDSEAYGRDLELNGDVFSFEEGWHILVFLGTKIPATLGLGSVAADPSSVIYIPLFDEWSRS